MVRPATNFHGWSVSTDFFSSSIMPAPCPRSSHNKRALYARHATHFSRCCPGSDPASCIGKPGIAIVRIEVASNLENLLFVNGSQVIELVENKTDAILTLSMNGEAKYSCWILILFSSMFNILIVLCIN